MNPLSGCADRPWAAPVIGRGRQPKGATNRGAYDPNWYPTGEKISDADFAGPPGHHARLARICPSLHDKPASPHTLRHTAAMQLLHAGVDTTIIALWLGQEQINTTAIYLHADLTLKERAIARTAPPNTSPGRYRAPDALLAFLDGL